MPIQYSRQVTGDVKQKHRNDTQQHHKPEADQDCDFLPAKGSEAVVKGYCCSFGSIEGQEKEDDACSAHLSTAT